MRFSWEDRSSFVLITQDAKTITAEKGWRAARINVPIREGNWYWEFNITRAGGEGAGASAEDGGSTEGSWCRVGVGRRESSLNAPVGFDGHSYAYRDKSGDSVTLSRPKPYGTAYGSNSTIGIYISLPPRPPPTSDKIDRKDPSRIVRKRVPILYKGQTYFESLEYTISKEMEDLALDPSTKQKPVLPDTKVAAPGTKSKPPQTDLTPPPRPLPKLPKSKIAFFLDGVCQGVAFEDIFDFIPLKPHPKHLFPNGASAGKDPRENYHDDGMTGYFPFVSVFGGAIAGINPGPTFDFPPPDDIEETLKNSPHPPTTSPIIFPTSTSSSPQPQQTSWKPLSDRYVEFLAEQSRLDDLDEEIYLKTTKSNPLPPNKPPQLKKSKLSTVRRDTSSSSASASASPAPIPLATADTIFSFPGSTSLTSGLRGDENVKSEEGEGEDVVPESDGDETPLSELVLKKQLVENEEDVKMDEG